MQKKFITNLALLLSLNLLIKPFWVLGIDRFVQIAVGAEQYGFYYAIFNFSFLINILLDFGITNFNNKNIAQNNHLLNKHFSSIVVLRFLLAGIFLVITMLGGWLIGYTPDMLKMLILLAFNQILISFILYLRSNLAGLHLFKTDSIISILDRVIMIVICGFLLIGHMDDHSFSLKWFVLAQTAAYLITALITFVIVIDKAKFRKFEWNFPFFLMILKKSYPYAVLVLLMTFYNRIDGVMLERMLPFRKGAEQAGIYASAYRLLDSANMIAYLFAGLLLPMFARMIKQKKSVEDLVRLSFSLLVIPAFIVAVGSYFYKKEFMDLLYREHIEAAAKVFGIMMWCFVAIASSYIFGTLLTANGNLRELNIMASTGMLVNIGLNLYLIPRYQAAGSAVSSLITQLFTASMQIVLVQLIFRFKINYRFLAACAVFFTGTVLLNMLSLHIPFDWKIRMSLAVAGAVILAFSLRVIGLKSIYHIVIYDK